MLGSILNIARSAISAHQTAVQVTSQNISNAHTEGYSRQRANLVAGIPTRTANGLLGSGVRVQDVNRMRDSLLDTTFRREHGNAAGFGVRSELLGQVEEIFGELSDSGLSGTIDAFWSSWGDLANNPSNGSVRGLVKQNAQQVVFALNNYSARLDTLRSNVNDRIDRTAEEFNVLARQVADINRQVVLAEASGRSAPDLRDRRDTVLDQMSKLAQIQVVERSDRTMAVFVGTTTMVDGGEARTLALDPGTQKLRIGTIAPNDIGGSLGALLDLRDGEIPNVRGRLDQFAEGLVQAVNSRHLPATGRAFFDPARTTAGNIALSPDIDDPAYIGTVPGSPGDNSIALEVATLREVVVPFAGGASKSLGAFYSDLVADIGLRLNSANRSVTVYETLVSQADTRRAATSGVSTDEELMQLMRHQ